MGRCLPAALALVALLVVASLAGCGAAPGVLAGNRIAGDRLIVDAGVPLDGAEGGAGRAVLAGAGAALARIGGRIGRYRITLRALDDASPRTGEWNAGQTTAAATAAGADPATIAYLGDYDSGASAISIPILNRRGIVQVSPASTAVGLTSDALGSLPGEPEAYYPTDRRTFARVVPNDLVQAGVQIDLQRAMRCRSTYVLEDGEYDAEETSDAFVELAQRRGLRILARQSYVAGAQSYASVGETVAQSGARCVLVAAVPGPGTVRLVTAVAAQDPAARLFATAGLAAAAFADPSAGGLPLALDRRVLVTGPAPATEPSPTAARVLAGLARAPGAAGEPVAVDAYEAMDLLLDGIRRATDGGRSQASRLGVLAAVFAARRRGTPIGGYRLQRDGDPTLDRFGVFRIVAGRLRLWKVMAA